jgi:hypothetical protein
MDNLTPVTSQRPVPGAMKTPPTSAPAAPAASPQNTALTALWEAHEAKPVQLLRTREGRSLSRARYRRAEEFMLPLAPEAPGDWPDFLYGAGIVAQLALSSHLLDVGFPDAWCARHIGLHVARSLAYANVSGLGLECTETARLAQVLTPYSKWNCRSLADSPRPNDGGFTSEETRALLRALIDHVGSVTGHRLSRPRVRRHNSLPS